MLSVGIASLLSDFKSELNKRSELLLSKAKLLDPFNISVDFIENITLKDKTLLRYAAKVSKSSEGFKLMIWRDDASEKIISAIDDLQLFQVQRIGQKELNLISNPMTISQIKNIAKKLDDFVLHFKQIVRNHRSTTHELLDKLVSVSKDDIQRAKKQMDVISQDVTFFFDSNIKQLQDKMMLKSKI